MTMMMVLKRSSSSCALVVVVLFVFVVFAVVTAAVATTAVAAYGQEEESAATTTAAEESSSASASAATAGDTTSTSDDNVTYVLGSELEADIMSQLSISDLISVKYHANGTGEAIMSNPYGDSPYTDMRLLFNHTYTDVYGFEIKNGTIMHVPTGTEVKVILERGRVE